MINKKNECRKPRRGPQHNVRRGRPHLLAALRRGTRRPSAPRHTAPTTRQCDSTEHPPIGRRSEREQIVVAAVRHTPIGALQRRRFHANCNTGTRPCLCPHAERPGGSPAIRRVACQSALLSNDEFSIVFCCESRLAGCATGSRRTSCAPRFDAPHGCHSGAVRCASEGESQASYCLLGDGESACARRRAHGRVSVRQREHCLGGCCRFDCSVASHVDSASVVARAAACAHSVSRRRCDSGCCAAPQFAHSSTAASCQQQ